MFPPVCLCLTPTCLHAHSPERLALTHPNLCPFIPPGASHCPHLVTSLLPLHLPLCPFTSPHRELLERLYHCLLGHLYHLARGQLLRLGAARGMSGPSSSSADVLLLGRDAAVLQTPGAGARAVAAAALRGGPGGGPKTLGAGSTPAAAGVKQDGVALVAAAAASGVLSPPLVAACQELLGVPLCAYSCLVAKVADGAAGAHAYDVQTPRRPAEDVSGGAARGVVGAAVNTCCGVCVCVGGEGGQEDSQVGVGVDVNDDKQPKQQRVACGGSAALNLHLPLPGHGLLPMLLLY